MAALEPFDCAQSSSQSAWRICLRQKNAPTERRGYREGTTSVSWTRQSAPSKLSGVQLDDQLLVDDRLHLIARRNVRDFSFECIAIDREPIGHRHNLRKLQIA
jgi:hypothetical protein